MTKFLFLVLFLLAFTVKGQEFRTESGKVIFLSQAPLSEFTGESKSLKGLIDFEKNLVDFYIDLNTLKTGILLRDKHMRENYLETEKFPFAEFTGKFESLPKLSSTPEKVKVIGKF
jgi:polyisoprenoid-binding protein YceI